ncbi:MAG: hypothetical protein ACJ8M4_06655 [Chthoniobacterales bacterium]
MLLILAGQPLITKIMSINKVQCGPRPVSGMLRLSKPAANQKTRRGKRSWPLPHLAIITFVGSMIAVAWMKPPPF